jgi:hypothetical protein
LPKRIALLLELLGAAAIVYGAYLLAEWLAWIVGGVVLVAIALYLETEREQ